MTDRQNLEVGDEVKVVVLYPNEQKDRDPVVKIDGVTGFLQFDDRGFVPDFGDVYRARVADVSTSHRLLIPLEKVKSGPGGDGDD